MDWYMSEHYCQNYISSHLATFKSDNDISGYKDLLNSIYDEDQPQGWIGFYRKNSSLNWEWADGYNDTTYTKWDHSPLNSELCVEMKGGGSPTEWQGETCDTKTDCFACNMPNCMY